MKTAILASLVASAAAFAPANKQAASSTAMSAKVDDMDGAINFAGKPFKFDP